MAGICGWFGIRPPADPSSCLSTMLAALRRERPGTEPAASAMTPLGALGVAPEIGLAAELHDDARGVLASIGTVGSAASEPVRRVTRESLSSIDGDFVLAQLDREDESLLLATDRFGIRELYYCERDGGLVFASRGRSLAAHPDVRKAIDPQGIYDYVYFHMVPSPGAVFQGWKRLLPGEYLRCARGTIERGRYWAPAYVDSGSSAVGPWVGPFREAMKGAVDAARVDAGRVGAFLSGGTDSSTICGWLAELERGETHAYSIGFDVPGFDETSYARTAAAHFGLQHNEYVVTPDDVADLAPHLAEAYDAPFGNSSAIASYYCARLAKEDGIETLLGGDGGDEIFAGNKRYDKQRLFEYYQALPAALRTKLLDPLSDRLPSTPGAAQKLQSYVRQASVPLPDRLESYNFVNRMSAEAIFDNEFLASVRPDAPLELLRTTYREAPTRSTLHKMLYLDLKFTLADNDLRKVGGACEMAGVRVRYPFLHLPLVELANRLPPRAKLRPGKLRYFFKRASEGFLPDAILTKSKHGFGVPCGRWMREHPRLNALAYDNLSSLAGRGYLHGGFANRLRELHYGEHGDYYGVMLWTLAMLELWHQHHAP